MFMYAVLHGIAQIPVGKAQNLAQNEVKFSYSDEEHQRRQTYVLGLPRANFLSFFGRFKKKVQGWGGPLLDLGTPLIAMRKFELLKPWGLAG